VAIVAGLAKWGEVIIIIGLEGQDEGVCAVHVSGESVEPTHDPNAKGEGIVNPVFRIIIFVFARNRCVP
jgi:hypothetical protein